MNMNYQAMKPEKVAAMRKEAMTHLNFCMAPYQIQIDNGMYFLHEHPAGAKSWQHEEVKRLLEMPGIKRIVSHMCAFGMMQEDEHGKALIKKPTAFMSNSSEILKRLARKCSGDHRHILLVNGRAKRAEVYPDELCKEIVKGLVDQMVMDHRIKSGCIGVMDQVDDECTLGLLDMMDDGRMVFYDDVSGKMLRTEQVQAARREELETFKQFGVYCKVPLQECYDLTGKSPLGIKWVDINKGDEMYEEYRSRLVANEIKYDKRID